MKFDSLDKVIRIILLIPIWGWITSGLYRIFKYAKKGNVVTLVVGVLCIVPFVGFNDLGTNFGELDNYFHLQDTFFKQWRYWVLLAWTFVSIPVDMFVIKKFKINIIYLIIANIALCMVLFEPWLN